MIRPNSSYRYFDDRFSVLREGIAPWIGLVVIALPLSILISIQLGWLESRDTISHYYYSVFMGDLYMFALIFVGTFMIAYKGESIWESLLASIGGFSCFGVALFPTDGSGLPDEASASGRVFVDMTNIPDDPKGLIDHNDLFVQTAFFLFKGSALLHSVFAAILFVILAIFCFFIFTRVKENQRQSSKKPKAEKRRRNNIYYLCGIAISVSIGMIAIDSSFGKIWNDHDYTLAFESLALFAFGLAWLTKGKFWGWEVLADQ